VIDQWITDEIDNLCHVEYGTRVVQKTDGGSIYPVYGGGGPTFAMDTYNREDRLVIARFAMSAKCTRFVKGKFFLNDSGLTLSPKDRLKIDQEFLNYQCLAMNNVFYSLAKGSAQKNLDVPAFRKLKLNIPKDINTQKNIVLKLDAILAAIDKATAAAEANAKNAEVLFQSYLTRVYFENLEGNKVYSLGELCNFQGGSQPPKSNFIYEPKDGYVRFLQIRDFGSDKNITYIPNSSKNKLCDVNDIMIGRYGASVGKILRGKSGAYNVALIKASPNNKIINKEYFWYYLNSSLFQDDLKKVASRSAQNGFGKDDIYNFQVPLPPLATQQNMVTKLVALGKEVDVVAHSFIGKSINLSSLRQSVLTKAFFSELV
jgi:type I restriction enzyme S subunit